MTQMSDNATVTRIQARIAQTFNLIDLRENKTADSAQPRKCSLEMIFAVIYKANDMSVSPLAQAPLLRPLCILKPCGNVAAAASAGRYLCGCGLLRLQFGKHACTRMVTIESQIPLYGAQISPRYDS